MITDAILNLFLGVFSFFWGLMPPWEMALPPAGYGLVSEISMWDDLIPFTELMQITAVMGGLFAALVGFKVVIKLIDWLSSMAPG